MIYTYIYIYIVKFFWGLLFQVLVSSNGVGFVGVRLRGHNSPAGTIYTKLVGLAGLLQKKNRVGSDNFVGFQFYWVFIVFLWLACWVLMGLCGAPLRNPWA